MGASLFWSFGVPKDIHIQKQQISKAAVNKAIRQILLTRIIVANKLETIAMAKRVAVLQQGDIVKGVMQIAQVAA